MTGTGIRWQWLWYVWEHLGALDRTLGAPWSAGNISESADENSESADDLPGSTDDKPLSTWERRWQSWEHLESLSSSLGKTSSLWMLLVHLEIIPTTYCSTIIKTDVFSLYSHLFIYIETHLHMVFLDWLQVVLESNSRCTWGWQSSELRDTLRGSGQPCLEMCLEAVIEWTWRS